MSDMLLEVDEALRAQQIKALWDKYGQWVIGFAVVLVLATIVGVVWHNHMNKIFTRDTTALLEALQSNAEDKKILAKLATLEKEASAPLKGIVSLYEAQVEERIGSLKAAKQSYESVASTRGNTKQIRELGTLHAVRVGMVLKDKPEDLLKQIEPLTEKGTTFYASASELKGLLLLRTGKTAEANAIFEELSVDTGVPTTMRARAKALIQSKE